VVIAVRYADSSQMFPYPGSGGLEVADVDFRAGAGLGLDGGEEGGGGCFVDVGFAAVFADLRGDGFHDEGEVAAFQGHGRRARGGAAFAADGAVHDFLLL
jgi:hypothetical protein